MPRRKRNPSKQAIWEKEVSDRIDAAIEKLEEMKQEKLAMLDLEYKNILMAFPEDVLNTPIDMNDERFRALILGVEESVSDETSQQPPSIVVPTAGKRRSRSASSRRPSQRNGSKVRSTSIDIYMTPRGRMRLSTIKSNEKYTVTKPERVQNSGFRIKRIMKPDEEAISTRGSPLQVTSGNFHVPHVNIPLPGGTVLNIEPKEPKGPLQISGLDKKTKSQIKLLCEQLKKIC